MNDSWEIIARSAVIAALVSGIISIFLSRLQHRDALRTSQYNKRLDLSIEVFRNLQQALEQIEHLDTNTLPTDNPVDDIYSAFTILFSHAKEKMEVLKTLLDQVSYLIPLKQFENLFNKYLELKHFYALLLASSYKLRGVSDLYIKEEFANNAISGEDLQKQMKKYIDDTQELSDELKREIVNSLRELCGTR